MFKNIVSNIKNNLISVILLGVTAVASLIAGILYIATGVTAFALKLDYVVVVLCFVAAAIALISIVFGFKTLKYLTFVALLAALLEFVRVELDFIANVFVGIDRTSFTPSFIITLVMLLVGLVAGLVSGITSKEFELKK